MQHAKVEICGVNTATLKLLTSERKEELLRKGMQRRARSLSKATCGWCSA